MLKYVATTALAAVLALSTVTPADAFWGKEKSADEKVSADLETQLKEGEKQVPLPAIVNWTERRAVQWLYELRDDPDFRTHSYLFTINGDFIKLCDSIGFGINASIQFANPIKHTDPGGDAHGNGAMPLPQAEPNGLFMPEGLAATYVMCIDPSATEDSTDAIKPVYVEPDLIVSPFPLGNQ